MTVLILVPISDFCLFYNKLVNNPNSMKWVLLCSNCNPSAGRGPFYGDSIPQVDLFSPIPIWYPPPIPSEPACQWLDNCNSPKNVKHLHSRLSWKPRNVFQNPDQTGLLNQPV